MNKITHKASQGFKRVCSSPRLQPHNLDAYIGVDQMRGTKTHPRSSFQHSPTNHSKWVLSTNQCQTCNLHTATSGAKRGGSSPLSFSSAIRSSGGRQGVQRRLGCASRPFLVQHTATLFATPLRSVHLCRVVFVSALRAFMCSRDLHTRASPLSARNTSGESLTYMRELNDSQQRCLQKFINICMVDGKKTKSHFILTNTFARLANYGDVVAFVMNAIENVKPIIEIKKVRISGSTQMVPSLISKRRQETLAIRWIVEAALQRRKAKQSFNLEQCLFAEIVDASNKVGVVRKKRDELHKLAEANRGFAHYRWW